MIRRGRPTLFLVIAAWTAFTSLHSLPARADEEDDIQRQIDAQRAGVPDLEHLDARHGAAAELQRLREWLNEAWALRNKHDTDAAREVLDRCLSQGELIRQVIAASQSKADVAAREAKLQKTRQEIERTKQALRESEAKKKSLEQAARS